MSAKQSHAKPHHEHAHSHDHAHEHHEQEHEHAHDHDHEHEHHEQEHAPSHEHHAQEHGPKHEQGHGHATHSAAHTVLTIRPYSGLSGDMMLAGLAKLADVDTAGLHRMAAELRLPALEACVTLAPRFVNSVAGWGCTVTLPHEHAHRTLGDIRALLHSSALPEEAQTLAVRTFEVLAAAEAAVHGKSCENVTFHEVGALDSILDIALVCRLFVLLAPTTFVCGPLPVADGDILCAHGHMPAPAPAVLRLLEGVPVYPFQGSGETVTPTALALLKALGAHFGHWPAMTVRTTTISYGTRVFENAPNGAVWAWGEK